MIRLLYLVVCICFEIYSDVPYYEISDIEVKQVDINGYKAKQKALDTSIKKAFDSLLSTEFPQINTTSANFTVNNLQSSIYDYAIDFEKISDTVYVGRFTYRFKRDGVVQLLRNAGHNVQIATTSDRVRVAFPRSDYVANIKELRKFHMHIQEFDEMRVVCIIDAKLVNSLDKLSIRYLRL